MRLGVFLVSSPRHPNLNVITMGNTREVAKGMAQSTLGGNPDEYTVTPISSPGTRTIFITVTEALEATG
jgi:hypothetical protein